MSAFLHLMKIMPALPETRALAWPASRPSRAHGDPLQRLVEVVVVEQAHPQVAVGRAVVDGPDRQVHVDRVDVALEGQRIADLQVPSLASLRPIDAAVLVRLEGRELVGGTVNSSRTVKTVLGVDGELGERHRSRHGTCRRTS